MVFIKNLKVSQKVVLIVVIINLFMLSVTGQGLRSYNKEYQMLNTMYNDMLLPVNSIGDIKFEIQNTRMDLEKYVVLFDQYTPEQKQKESKKIKSQFKEINEEIDGFNKLNISDEEKKYSLMLRNEFKEYEKIADNTIEICSIKGKEEGLN